MGSRTGARAARRPTLDESLPFGVALGHRLRRAREDIGWTSDDVAGHARLLGLSWDRSTYSRIEGGQRQLTAAELLTLPAIFGQPLADLLPTEACALNEAAAVGPAELRTVLTERGPHLRRWALPRLSTAVHEGLDRLRPVLASYKADYPDIDAMTLLEAASDGWADETTAKAARRLGVDRRDVAVAARITWDRGLAAERDQRLGEGGEVSARTRQARRGHITRTLLDELRPVVEKLRQQREKGGKHGKR